MKHSETSSRSSSRPKAHRPWFLRHMMLHWIRKSSCHGCTWIVLESMGRILICRECRMEAQSWFWSSTSEKRTGYTCSILRIEQTTSVGNTSWPSISTTCQSLAIAPKTSELTSNCILATNSSFSSANQVDKTTIYQAVKAHALSHQLCKNKVAIRRTLFLS